MPNFSTMEYVLNPNITFQISDDDNISCFIGRGDSRNELKFDNYNLLNVLLQIRHPKFQDDIATLLSDEMETELSESKLLIQELINDDILIFPLQNNTEAIEWEENGWRDALDFHLACENLTFDASMENVEEGMKKYFAMSNQGLDSGLEPVYKTYPHEKAIFLNNSFNVLSNVSFGEIINAYTQVNAFKDICISFNDFSELLNITHGAIKDQETTIGTIMFRTSPSGGSLHPIEAYVVINNVENIEKGLYHYNCKNNSIELLKTGDFKDFITDICHNKNGIRTASFVILHTCRWGRHIWKYRYSRSYRMVHFDLGHIIQTSVLTAQALGLSTFHNPAVNDKAALDFLGLSDDCEEGVLFSLGFGIKDY